MADRVVTHAITHTLRFGEKTVTVGQSNAEGPMALSFHGFRVDYNNSTGELTVWLDVEEADCTAEVLEQLAGQ